MKSSSTLIFIYNSFGDPLFQNLILSYIKTLSQNINGKFFLITFEQSEYAISTEAKKSIKEELLRHKIFWFPLTFHTGRFILLKKFWDICQAIGFVTWIRIRYQTSRILAFANVSASISSIFCTLLNMKLIIYSYEPHAQFMVESKQWNAKSLKYKILHRLEQHAAEIADHIMTGTKFMKEQLEAMPLKGKVYRAPTAVDETIFSFEYSGRETIRKSLNLDGEKLIIYFGKFGGLYYEKEVIEVMASINTIHQNCFFLIATNYDHGLVKQWCEEFSLPADIVLIRDFIPMDEMSDYLSAADLGLVAIPPSPSQKFRSPTKVAEYMLCGLPFVICQGVSEDAEMAIEHDLGIVLPEFKEQFVKDQTTEFDKFLRIDKETYYQKSRHIGLEYRSKQRIDNILLSIYSEQN